MPPFEAFSFTTQTPIQQACGLWEAWTPIPINTYGTFSRLNNGQDLFLDSCLVFLGGIKCPWRIRNNLNSVINHSMGGITASIASLEAYTESQSSFLSDSWTGRSMYSMDFLWGQMFYVQLLARKMAVHFLLLISTSSTLIALTRNRHAQQDSAPHFLRIKDSCTKLRNLHRFPHKLMWELKG